VPLSGCSDMDRKCGLKIKEFLSLAIFPPWLFYDLPGSVEQHE
jgi:hypothetical protein